MKTLKPFIIFICLTIPTGNTSILTKSLNTIFFKCLFVHNIKKEENKNKKKENFRTQFRQRVDDWNKNKDTAIKANL